MSYRVSITPTGRRSVDALRGKARRSFDAAVERLVAEGCAAGDHRLTGEGIEHICALHLYGRYCALVAFPDDASVVVLLVGEHLADDPELDVYRDLYRSWGCASQPRSGPSHRAAPRAASRPSTLSYSIASPRLRRS